MLTMPDRITLSMAKGWRMPPGTVKVDRATIWGNPWRSGSPGSLLDRREYRPLRLPVDAPTAVRLYTLWLAGVHLDPIWLPDTSQWPPGMVTAMRDALHGRRMLILSRLDELRGKNLACWCKPGCACHADTLLEVANA